MKNTFIYSSAIIAFGFSSFSYSLYAQTSAPTAAPVSATLLPFRVDSTLETCPIPETPIAWGMDVAWNDKSNVRRGTNFIGKDVLSIGRISFQPSDLVDAEGNLSAAQKSALNSRLDNIALSGVHHVILNCDHEKLNKDNYYGKPYEWYRVIKASVLHARSKGFTVITVSPFNEPDYAGWGEGSKDDFREICRYISEDTELAGIRISAGNTLNCDQALSWYDYMKPYVTEGNTHQLAGSFAKYASFWQTVRVDGNHATADELHNVGEAFIGVHYGMQSGVWWGYEAAARGEYCRASYYGKEIGYAENRTAWNAGCVYKQPDGKVQAFFGTSERQASPSSYHLLSLDHDVYYEGAGPMRSLVITLPGGTGYQQGQTNAERMIPIQYGADVPVEPLAAGAYVIENQNSALCMGFYNGATANGTQIVQTKYTGTASKNWQHWIIEPIDSRSGGDYGYFLLRSERNTAQVIDVKDWSLEAGGTLIGYAGGLGTNEQWMTEYAGDGYYYIRSRHSGLYLEVPNGSTTNNARIQQAAWNGEAKQRWRFIPTDASLEQQAPSVPTGLTATPLSGAVLLTWEANADTDVDGYEILRDGDVIGRMIAGTSFIDHEATLGLHSYQIRAVDHSRNRSELSQSVDGSWSPSRSLFAHYTFDQQLTDQTENHHDAASTSSSFQSVAKREGTHSLTLNGTNDYLMLPPVVGTLPQMTIALWCNVSNYTKSWIRIFDFGNGTDQYMFLTGNNGNEMRFVIKNHGDEQILSAPKLNAGWHHVAVSIGEESVTIYVDGNAVASSSEITLRPSDLCSVLNYVGRSQFAADPLLKGNIDDLRIYSVELKSEDILALYHGEEISSLEQLGIQPEHSVEGIFGIDGIRRICLQPGLNIIRRGNVVKKVLINK